MVFFTIEIKYGFIHHFKEQILNKQKNYPLSQPQKKKKTTPKLYQITFHFLS